jgi:hypothetical protein
MSIRSSSIQRDDSYHSHDILPRVWAMNDRRSASSAGKHHDLTRARIGRRSMTKVDDRSAKDMVTVDSRCHTVRRVHERLHSYILGDKNDNIRIVIIFRCIEMR